MSIALTVPERAQRVVASDLEINILGPCEFPSPLADRLSQAAVHYVGQAERVLLDDRLSRLTEFKDDLTRAPAFELAGHATGCFSIRASSNARSLPAAACARV